MISSSLMSSEQLLVRRIRNGTVLDHLQAGRALQVLKALGLDGTHGSVITVAMNMPSSKIDKKDMLKVENKYLSREEADRIALIAPRATVNLIKDFRVAEKHRVELPEVFTGVFVCPNPGCITNSPEALQSSIQVLKRDDPLLQCRYCRRVLHPEELL